MEINFRNKFDVNYRIMTIIIGIVLLITTFSCSSKKLTDNSSDQDYAKLVNPLIGTDAFIYFPLKGENKYENLKYGRVLNTFGGGVYPGAQRPFGMVQLSPDTHEDVLPGRRMFDYCGGYIYLDNTIAGFSHIHTSGNEPNYEWILFQPVNGDIKWYTGKAGNPGEGYRSRYSHGLEKARAGYYAVKLVDYDILVECTATERVGFQRYTFPESVNAHILLDLSHSNHVSPKVQVLNIENNQRITGTVGDDELIYFVIELSKPFLSYQTLVDGRSMDKSKRLEGRSVKVSFDYNTLRNEEIMVKTALSPTSVENAILNLNTELPGWEFDKTVTASEQAWNKELGKIKVKGGTREQQEIFYTSLYRTMMRPSMYFDSDALSGRSEENKKDHPKTYNHFSFWDTYRAEHALINILHPDRVNDMLKSVVNAGIGGSNGMAGDHTISILTEAYIKGYRDFNVEEVYKEVKNIFLSDQGLPGILKKYKYVPQDFAPKSVAETLEYSYDFWCLAEMAKLLGYKDDYNFFIDLAWYYKNVFDKGTGFFRPKFSDGSWLEPFDPRVVSHQSGPSNTGFVEANAWQYLFHVQHDFEGLIRLMGGRENFTAKLDQLFSEDPELKGEVSSCVTGLVGQYAHGNEMSHHVAYVYNYGGAPWKSQEKVRQIMEEQYSTLPNGLCGNDDAGQLCSWYVFSALGFYPVNPAEGNFVIGTPLFDEVVLNVGNGNSLVIEAQNVSIENKYIQSVTLNGKYWNKPWFKNEDIIKGGKLIFRMGNKPNKEWGASPESAPPSMSKI